MYVYGQTVSANRRSCTCQLHQNMYNGRPIGMMDMTVWKDNIISLKSICDSCL